MLNKIRTSDFVIGVLFLLSIFSFFITKNFINKISETRGIDSDTIISEFIEPKAPIKIDKISEFNFILYYDNGVVSNIKYNKNDEISKTFLKENGERLLEADLIKNKNTYFVNNLPTSKKEFIEGENKELLEGIFVEN